MVVCILSYLRLFMWHFHYISMFFLCWILFVSPEFSYRPGLGSVSEDSNNTSAHTAGGPPNRPLPPTPDDEDQNGERTLIMKRVSIKDYLKILI